MKHTDIINSLDLEQKCALLSGGTVFTTRALPGKGIPAITLSDGPNGVRKQAGAADHLGLNPSVPATCFPTSATVANSWDPELGEAVGAAMGEEAAAQGVSVLLGPGLNIKRSPLCGRNFEYFSEDPYLAGKMAAAYVRGIQKNGIAACPKHFAVNSQELRRMASDSIVDERTLREIYLTGFEMVVKEAQPKTIMSAYNLVNGTYANENAHLLQDILRRDWGFDGAVVTDWGGSNDHALGVKNGSTLEMPFPGDDSVRELMKAVESGKISEHDVDARLDELLELVLGTKAAVEKAPRTFDAAAHHALARRAAAQSIVLLRNEGALLPLKKGEKIAVLGDFARTPRYQGAGSSAVNSIQVDSFLDCLTESGLTNVGYAQGFDRQGKADEDLKKEAVALAQNANVVLLCMGLDEIKESEGLDRMDMKLAQNQLDLLAARMAGERFDVIYSSPLRRSVKTAQACNRAHRLPIHVLNSLIEINGGAFEGLPFADFPKCYPRESALWNDEPHAFAIEKGESMQQVFDRMRDAVLLLAARHPGKTVLLASHGCAIRNLLCWAHGWPIERLNDVNWGENTCVSVLEVDESGTPRLLLENDASHLPADCATLGKQDWWRPEYRHDPFGR